MVRKTFTCVHCDWAEQVMPVLEWEGLREGFGRKRLFPAEIRRIKEQELGRDRVAV